MKLFLRKVAIFVFSPFLLLGILDAALPSTFFAYRSLEGMVGKYRNRFQGSFYPNEYNEMIAQGDLCHHTENAIWKKEVWQTDQLGFRNNHFISNPDVIIMGDSFMVGVSLSQDDLMVNQLGRLNTNMTFYNLSPSTFNDLNSLFEVGMIGKPKLILFSLVERNVPRKLSIKDSDFVNSFSSILKGKNKYFDKPFKGNSLQWLRARVNAYKGPGKPSLDPNMFFLAGTEHKHNPDDLEQTASRIISYKEYCDKKGIKFLFVPMPDKESVYFDKVPLDKQPSYLLELDKILNEANVETVNTLKIYNDYRSKNTNLVYYPDDTHWNPNGVALIAKAVSLKMADMKVSDTIPAK